MKQIYILTLLLFTINLVNAQVSKTDTNSETLDASIATRILNYSSAEISGNITKIELDLTLTITDNSGCAPGAFGVHNDIAVSLTSPNGTEVHIVQDFAGILIGSPPVEITYQDLGYPSIVNETATYSDDATLLADDQTFFGAGTWKPHNSFSAFNGENPIGNWTLRVADGRSHGFPDFTCYLNATLRITTDTNLSINDLDLSDRIKIYPNPSSDFIQISGLNKSEKYNLYDIQGKKISNGIIPDNKKIEIRNLKNGLYFLQFENRGTIKLIKE
ncbi:T9SS type A sorting domain-containing protein [Mangrovimonas cancribranchiae]|uniref:T9SS type A sorting domain-containing protein n=1 Tax=Mangrovimonas cancribranchiae TaxID=3080055 RepID=A0AAU6P817_9FLAO